MPLNARLRSPGAGETTSASVLAIWVAYLNNQEAEIVSERDRFEIVSERQVGDLVKVELLRAGQPQTPQTPQTLEVRVGAQPGSLARASQCS